MAFRDRIVEVIFSLTDKFSKPARQVKGAYKDIGDAAEKTESRVVRSARSIDRAFSRVASRLTGLFTAGALAAVTGQVNAFARELDDLAKTARRLDTTVEELQKLRFAAEQTGPGFETLVRGLERLNRVTSEAAEGSGQGVAALDELGLSAQELEGLRADERLKAVADALDGVSNQADKARIAYQLFGRAGNELILITAGGSAALDAFGEELVKTGSVATTEAAIAAEQYNDSLNRLSKRVDSLTTRSAPALFNFFNSFLNLVGASERTAADVRNDIRLLQREVDALDAGGFKAFVADFFVGNRLRANLAELRRELAGFEADQEQQADAQEERIRRIREAYAKGLTNTKNYVAQVQAEFDKLVEGPAKTQKAAEELDLIDLAKPISDAMSAFAQGDFDRAVEDARRAGDLLNDMREAGQYAEIVLAGSAQKIRDIAVAAARAQQGGAGDIELKVNEESLQRARESLEWFKQPIEVPITVVPNFPDELRREADKRGAKL